MLVVAVAAAGCRAARPASPEVPGAPSAAALSEAARLGALQALGVALLAEGSEERARALIAQLRGMELDRRERARVDAAERVLVGRELVRGLELSLSSEAEPDDPARRHLFLCVRSAASEEIRVMLPPFDLKRVRTSIDARGLEAFALDSRTCGALADLCLWPTVEQRVELLAYELPLGHALAVRERWRIETRSGEIERAGERFPAAGIRVEPCASERLSPLVELDSDPLASLAARLDENEAPEPRRMLELALLVPHERRDEALTRLTPLVERLAREAPERVRAAEPALRWLSENREIGPDPRGWARYLAARAAWGSAADGATPDGLDLPARPRATHRRDGDDG